MEFYEELIKNISNKEEMKELVRIMFKNLELEDLDFNDLIYMDVIPKLEELGVVFDREKDIDYETYFKEHEFSIPKWYI